VQYQVFSLEITDNVAGFKETRRMIESIFKKKWVVLRHQLAPPLPVQVSLGQACDFGAAKSNQRASL
jgi:hypothetical protein